MKSFKTLFLVLIFLTLYSGNIFSYSSQPVLDEVFSLGELTLGYNKFTSMVIWGSGKMLGNDGSRASAYSYGILGGISFGLAGMFSSNIEIAQKSPDPGEASNIRTRYGLIGAVTGLICGNIYGYYNSTNNRHTPAINYRLNYENDNLNFSVKRKI